MSISIVLTPTASIAIVHVLQQVKWKVLGCIQVITSTILIQVVDVARRNIGYLDSFLTCNEHTVRWEDQVRYPNLCSMHVFNFTLHYVNLCRAWLIHRETTEQHAGCQTSWMDYYHRRGSRYLISSAQSIY